MQTETTKLKNHTGVVHYASSGTPACGPVGTHKSWLIPTSETVTCQRCIAKLGADDTGREDAAPHIDENIARRAAERAARRAAR